MRPLRVIKLDREPRTAPSMLDDRTGCSRVAVGADVRLEVETRPQVQTTRRTAHLAVEPGLAQDDVRLLHAASLLHAQASADQRQAIPLHGCHGNKAGLFQINQRVTAVRAIMRITDPTTAAIALHVHSWSVIGFIYG